MDSLISSNLSSAVSRPGVFCTRSLMESGVSPVGLGAFLFFKWIMACSTSLMVGAFPSASLGSLSSIRSKTVGSNEILD